MKAGYQALEELLEKRRVDYSDPKRRAVVKREFARRTDPRKSAKSDDYESDEVFQHARSISHEFRGGVLDLLFDTRSGLFELTKTYGVF